jgi:hypothetical protein
MKPFRTLLCATLLAASSTMGQTKPADVVVTVPFAFVVAGQEFPAGRYVITEEGDVCLRIFNPQWRGLYVPTRDLPPSATDGSKMVFHRYGHTYFLSAVWLTGDTTGRELFPSRPERELAEHKAEMELAIVRSMELSASK